jgi:hypothetical protein
MNSKLIDPKLSEIPLSPEELAEQERIEQGLTAEERQARLHARPIRGLSIKETIANSANHSVGAQGVGTSGVETGVDTDPDDVSMPGFNK